MNNIDILLIIIFVAIGTYTLRFSGLFLANKLKRIKHIDLLLEAIPATLLISLVVPSIIKTGIIGIIAAGVSILIMHKTKNTFLSMSIAVVIVALHRNGLLL
ncbi:branched-chain amino acid ABC transporter [Malaciobacter molluscorum LMG 25693]|uniref:Branched-chain amino acid ABC transporter n=1 Tax=Malaciobacter molluscorum LMG 25693 TaxID=870501 RepID=A0A2G1DF46_9BACT|nr:AzlD domain-containing protein [Malaciobacter molluscorum]AXX91253.1 branched-chain amino acid transport protein, AzlD family [Malaciobacter molluscorum LMG 25693]PHO17070.1 branched-chain amino acid ABC transporter [Malaciobacter molluscorum LMG 25693]